MPAKLSTSSTSVPDLTRPKPTARPDASSRPPCANGPTLRPTKPRITESKRSSPGYNITHGIARTAAYNAGHTHIAQKSTDKGKGEADRVENGNSRRDKKKKK